ncbi:hypothetical protein MKW94_022013, partial [Papaver nudicaule]|nr:hypothetical protein [Papaver nudicaule]
ALGGAPDILDGRSLDFCNLQLLELQTYLSRDCLHSVLYILKISPNLESLSLKISERNYQKPPVYPFCDEVKINPENIGDYWDAGLSLPCMICHLKFVEIKGLRGCKLVLARYSAKQDSQREKRMTKFSEMLLMFPRASKNIISLCRF